MLTVIQIVMGSRSFKKCRGKLNCNRKNLIKLIKKFEWIFFALLSGTNCDIESLLKIALVLEFHRGFFSEKILRIILIECSFQVFTLYE